MLCASVTLLASLKRFKLRAFVALTSVPFWRDHLSAPLARSVRSPRSLCASWRARKWGLQHMQKKNIIAGLFSFFLPFVCLLPPAPPPPFSRTPSRTMSALRSADVDILLGYVVCCVIAIVGFVPLVLLASQFWSPTVHACVS